MREVEASAPTREQAIQSALDELGVEMYEVDKIEIMDEGSKGLFGFGARPVRVKVIVDKLEEAPVRPARGRERGGRDSARREERPQERQQVRGREQGRERREQEREGGRRERPRREAREGGRGEGGERKRGGEQAREEERGRGGERQREDKRPHAAERSREQAASQAKPSPKPPRRERATERERETEAAAAPEERPETQEAGTRAEQQPTRERSRGRGGRGRRDSRDRNGKTTEAGAGAAPESAAADDTPREAAASGRGHEPEEELHTITDEQGQDAAALLQEIIGKMGIEAQVQFKRADEGVAMLSVASEDGAILIGRKGRTLSALQYLINRMISQHDTQENTERLVVDVEGYVDRRRETLEELAKNFARKAKETGRNMRLKPLSPQERRVIHLTLQDDPEVRTFSIGESLYRSVVISPTAAQTEEGEGGEQGEERAARPARRSRGNRGGRGRGRGQQHQAREAEIDAGQFGD